MVLSFSWEMNEKIHWGYLESNWFVLLPPLEYKKNFFNLIRRDLLPKAEGLCGCHNAVNSHSHKKVIVEMFGVSY